MKKNTWKQALMEDLRVDDDLEDDEKASQIKGAKKTIAMMNKIIASKADKSIAIKVGGGGGGSDSWSGVVFLTPVKGKIIETSTEDDGKEKVKYPNIEAWCNDHTDFFAWSYTPEADPKYDYYIPKYIDNAKIPKVIKKYSYNFEE